MMEWEFAFLQVWIWIIFRDLWGYQNLLCVIKIRLEIFFALPEWYMNAYSVLAGKKKKVNSLKKVKWHPFRSADEKWIVSLFLGSKHEHVVSRCAECMAFIKTGGRKSHFEVGTFFYFLSYEHKIGQGHIYECWSSYAAVSQR